MRNPFKKKIVWVDPLELAQRAADEALAVFNQAKSDLSNANDHLGSVKQAAANAIVQAQARHDEAHRQELRNTATLQKLDDLTG
jgi:hypothetical protein